MKHFLWNRPQVNATRPAGDGTVRQQGITWTNIDQVLWRHIASLDDNELMQYTQEMCTRFALGRALSSLILTTWWRHQIETVSALLALCERNSPVTGEFPSQRPVTRSFDVFLDLRPNKQFSKQSMRRWFETPSRLSWRQSNDLLLSFRVTSLATRPSYDYTVSAQ